MNELRLIFSRDGDALTYRLATSWGDEIGEAQPFVPFLGVDPGHRTSAPDPPPLPASAPCPCGSGKTCLDCHAADTDATD